MKAEILYYGKTLPHPGDLEKQYWGKKYLEIHHGKKESISLSRGFFQKHWRTLPIREEVDTDKPLMEELERLFAKYNQDHLNPYSNTEEHFNRGEVSPGQQKIRDLHVHTSMSVGDVIKINNSHYIVAGTGFKKLFLTLDKRR